MKKKPNFINFLLLRTILHMIQKIFGSIWRLIACDVKNGRVMTLCQAWLLRAIFAQNFLEHKFYETKKI